MSKNPFLDVSEFPAAPPPSKEVNGLTADIFVSAHVFRRPQADSSTCNSPVPARFVQRELQQLETQNNPPFSLQSLEQPSQLGTYWTIPPWPWHASGGLATFSLTLIRTRAKCRFSMLLQTVRRFHRTPNSFA